MTIRKGKKKKGVNQGKHKGKKGNKKDTGGEGEREGEILLALHDDRGRGWGDVSEAGVGFREVNRGGSEW